jgi:hypothetical protein
MKTLVNTDVKMPKKMFDALCLFETFCVGSKKHETTEDEVKAYLTKLHGAKFANNFNQNYFY